MIGQVHQLLLEALIHDVVDINLVEFLSGVGRGRIRSLGVCGQGYLMLRLLGLHVSLFQIAQELNELLLLQLGLTFLLRLKTI